MKKHQYFFLSGLPRSGSTLFSSIISQNPDIHSEGNSPVMQFMLDMHYATTVKCLEQVSANRKFQTCENSIKAIPDLYYGNTDKEYVFDKSRTWTHPNNVVLAKKYLTANPKIIVMMRPVEEVVASFVNLYEKNKRADYSPNSMLVEGTDPIMNALECLVLALQHCRKECLFITYDYFITHTEEVMEQVYKFLELKPFVHNLTKIVNKNKEDDSFYGLDGMHDVRPQIARVKNEVVLSENVLAHCKRLNQLIGLGEPDKKQPPKKPRTTVTGQPSVKKEKKATKK